MTIPAGEGDLTGTWSTELTYKDNGALETQKYPAAGGLTQETVIYNYDNTGALLTMTSGLGTYVSGTLYDPWGTAAGACGRLGGCHRGPSSPDKCARH